MLPHIDAAADAPQITAMMLMNVIATAYHADFLRLATLMPSSMRPAISFILRRFTLLRQPLSFLSPPYCC